MSMSSEERARLVAATANRLRLVQSDQADDPEADRRVHLDDVLARALERVAPPDRPAFLEALEAQFPTWDRNVQVADTGAALAARSTMDEKELKDPSFLVARLTALAPGLSDAQKRVMTDRLREAGIVPKSAGAAWPAEAMDRLRARLGCKTTDPEASRVVELLISLVEFASILDQLMWRTWKEVNPQSRVRRPAGMKGSLARFLDGDPEVGRGQVVQDVELLRSVTSALAAAVADVGKQFAQLHLVKFSPAEIKQLVTYEGSKGKGWFGKDEVAWWKKYEELAGALDEGTIETEIRRLLGDNAERLVGKAAIGTKG
ncbi:MAG: hypothetical protein ACKVW3_03870 [Phycisphaerales bacterium]